MIHLGQYTLVIRRDKYQSLRRNYQPDSFVSLFDALGFQGAFAFDNHLFAIDEKSPQDCFDCYETLLSCSALNDYSAAAIVVEGYFWRWGVSWLQIDYPYVSFRNPESVDLPVMWKLE